MKKFIFILFFTTSLFAQPSFITDSLDSYITREMQRWQVPGLAIAIVKDGKIVVAKGYGVKEFGKNEPVNEYTLFQIASNSKAFTGTAIALLDYQKKILLDEKVTTYLPDFRLYDDCTTQLCTVRDLLCHRIGLQTFQGDFLNWGSTLTRKEIINKIRDNKPQYSFRSKYGYCNSSFVTAGELIPAVTDTSWDAFLRVHFFEPLQMQLTNTSYKKMLNDKNACTPHTLVDGKLVTIPLKNIENLGPSASINSNVRDMANWILMQLDSGKFNGKQILPWKVLQETRKSQMLVNDVSSKTFKTMNFSTYGLGWFIGDFEGRKIYSHSGGSNGFVTKTDFIPQENLGIIVYTNTDANSLYDALGKQIIESYLSLPYRNLSQIYFERNQKSVETKEQQLQQWRDTVAQNNTPPLKLQHYTGTYRNTLYGDIDIRLEKGKLHIYFSHHPDNIGKLEYMKDNKFLCTYSDVTCGVQVTPFSIKDGKVESVTIKVEDFIDYLSYDFVKIK